MLADTQVLRPGSVDEALAVLAEAAERPTILAGGTDLMVLQNAGLLRADQVVDLWRLDELRGVCSADDGRIWIGALTAFEDLIGSELVQEGAPALVEAAKTIGAKQIQSRGTLGGNVANASPAGDSLPVLLAHGGDVVLQSARRGRRKVALDSFFRAYKEIDLEADELIVGFLLNPAPAGATSSFRKVGTRLAQAISKVMICGIGQLDGEGRIMALRLAAGAVAPVPMRLKNAEASALGKTPAEAASLVQAAASAEVAPIDDVRSNAEYRREVTGRLAARFVSSL